MFFIFLCASLFVSDIFLSQKTLAQVPISSLASLEIEPNLSDLSGIAKIIALANKQSKNKKDTLADPQEVSVLDKADADPKSQDLTPENADSNPKVLVSKPEKVLPASIPLNAIPGPKSLLPIFGNANAPKSLFPLPGNAPPGSKVPFVLPANFPGLENMFPNHMDLHKVGTISFKKEQYNVLRPTLHIMRDHFSDFMKQEKSDFPTKKLYVDDNGFRHYWSGFEEAIRDLRRSELSKVKEGEIKQNDTENLREQETKSDAANETQTESETKTEETTLAPIARHKIRPKGYHVPFGPTVHTYQIKPDLRFNDNQIPTAKAGSKKRTMVKTTFFCPFIGVLTMNSYLED